jgi:hypothetical protein
MGKAIRNFRSATREKEVKDEKETDKIEEDKSA